jgi:predicted carbohydrate-binding protein with CBM5 and CBM33 domain
MRPYYYIHNVNRQGNALPTNPVKSNNNVPSEYEGTDINGEYEVTSKNEDVATTLSKGSNFNRKFKLNNIPQSAVEKPAASRISNSSNVRLEIRYGKDNTTFELEEVQIDYVKAP